MNVRQILSNKGSAIHSIGPDRPLTEAVALMMHHRIGSLAVMEGDRLFSIITERDVMRAVHERAAEFTAIAVRDMMAPRLVCCDANESVNGAMDLMFHNDLNRRVRHLPITDGGALIGILSIGDIVEALLNEVTFENRLLRSYIKNWPEAEQA